MAESSAEFCHVVVWKATLVGDELDYLQRRFPSKMVNVSPGFFLVLLVKYEKKEIN